MLFVEGVPNSAVTGKGLSNRPLMTKKISHSTDGQTLRLPDNTVLARKAQNNQETGVFALNPI